MNEFKKLLKQLGFNDHEMCKFEPLHRYFKNIEEKDLIHIEKKLEDVAVPDDALLMGIFARELSIKMEIKYNMFARENTVDYKRKLSSTKLQIQPGKLNTPKLKDDLKLKVKRLRKDKFELIDMSNNQLHDCDLEHVCRAIQENSINIKVLDLSSNNFGDSKNYDVLMRMLRLNNFSHIIICENPIASQDHYEFLNNLSSIQLARLIWIPRPWVKSSIWEHMIKNEKLIMEIRLTHSIFYKLEEHQSLIDSILPYLWPAY